MVENWTSLNGTQPNVTRERDVPFFGMDGFELCMFIVVIAGVPGNVLVAAVYARKLTSSVRMYMFALAVTDVIICLSYATTAAMGTTRRQNGVYKTMWSLFNFGVGFSLLVLTLTAVERYWCIARPHSFTFSPRRGKMALLLTALLALATLVAMKVFRALHLRKTTIVHMMLHLGVCTLIILVMYTLLARELLRRFRRRKAKLQSLTPECITVTCQTPSDNDQSDARNTSVLLKPSTRLVAVPSNASMCLNPASNDKKITTAIKQTQEAKAALMLFVVTAVFLVCWMPFWLRTLGIPVPRVVLRVYVIQSVVNPAIYWCMSCAFRSDVRTFFSTCRR